MILVKPVFILRENTKKKIKFLYLFVFLFIGLNSACLHSQPLTATGHYESDTDLLQKSKPDYWLAAAETFGLNVLIWSFDRYIYQVDWARISWESVGNNLKYGFVWDADGFETNQFAHPYSGALSFSAARSSGISYWKSLPYPFASSLMWELFMETEYPSMNDIITTPMSGIVLGETSFRISNLVLFSGEKSVFREVAAFILSPMNGFNRLLCGKEIHNTRIRNKIPKYQIAFSAGLNGVLLDQEFSKKLSHLHLNFRMNYGRYAKIRKNYKPYDYFETEVGVNLAEYNTILAIFSSGMLLGKNLGLNSGNRGVLGLFQGFDFLDNRIYKISASTVGAGIMTRHSLSKNFTWDNSLITSIIVMGGVNSLYAFEVGRNYSLGPGTTVKYESYMNIFDFTQLFLRYKHYWIHPLSGTKGNEYVDILRLGTRFRFTQQYSLSFEFIEYDRWSKYRDYPNQKDNNYSVRIYFSYQFGRS